MPRRKATKPGNAKASKTRKPGKMRIETTKRSARFIVNGRTRFEVRARAGGGVEVIDDTCRYLIKPGDVRATTRR